MIDLVAESISSFRFWRDYRKTFTMRDSRESFSTKRGRRSVQKLHSVDPDARPADRASF